MVDLGHCEEMWPFPLQIKQTANGRDPSCSKGTQTPTRSHHESLAPVSKTTRRRPLRGPLRYPPRPHHDSVGRCPDSYAQTDVSPDSRTSWSNKFPGGPYTSSGRPLKMARSAGIGYRTSYSERERDAPLPLVSCSFSKCDWCCHN